MNKIFGKRIGALALGMVMALALPVTAFASDSPGNYTYSKKEVKGDGYYITFTDSNRIHDGQVTETSKYVSYGFNKDVFYDQNKVNTIIQSIVSSITEAKDYWYSSLDDDAFDIPVNGDTVTITAASIKAIKSLVCSDKSNINAINISYNTDGNASNGAEQSLYLYGFTSDTADQVYGLKKESNTELTAKLAAAGYTGGQFQFNTPGTGALANTCAVFDFSDVTGLKKDGKFYGYYYNEGDGSLTKLSDSDPVWLSSETNKLNVNLGVDAVKDKTINKGSYLVTDTELSADILKANKTNLDASAVMKTSELTTQAKALIDSTPAGGVAKLSSVASGTKVTKDVFAEAKAKGVGVEITPATGKVAWSFPVGSLTDDLIKAMADFDPTVTVGTVGINKNLAKRLSTVTQATGAKTVEIDFAYDGKLPGKADIKLDLSTAGFTNGATVYLYHYNEAENKFELADTAAYIDGSATFQIEHCSDYIVTDNALPADAGNKSPKTGVAGVAYFIYTAIILAAGTVLVAYKKKA